MRPHGLTLLELLLATALLAVLAALATPSFGSLAGRLALRAATREVLAGLALARTTALATGLAVTACPTTDERSCGFPGDRWMVFVNTPAGIDSRREADEAVLRVWSLPPKIGMTGTRGYVTYLPELRAATTATLDLRHAGLPREVTSIIISQTGRPRVSRVRPSI